MIIHNTGLDRKMIYVPGGFAQGYITLEDHTEICYTTSQFYSPEHPRGVRHNDSGFSIQWPIRVSVISDYDKHWEDY
jgi:dTDP-4-dehydrorhamnose 3,5-epimerase